MMRNVTPNYRARSKSWNNPDRSRSGDDDFAPETAMRFQRLRSLSWVLDRSIPLGKWRIGLDPIIGLLPGAGDWIGALLSLYVFYEGARLGMSKGVLTRM